MTNQAIGETLGQALVNLYNSDVPLYVQSFTQENQSYPYVVIPSFLFEEEWCTTKSRLESLEFSFDVYHQNLFKMEDVLEYLDDTFNQCHLNYPNRRFTYMEFKSSQIMELEPGIFLGKAMFKIIQEKDI